MALATCHCALLPLGQPALAASGDTPQHPAPEAPGRDANGTASGSHFELGALLQSAFGFSAGKDDGDKHFEAYGGGDAGSRHWLMYSGVTLAPFGDMHETGWRVRFSGGYGGYSYSYVTSGDGNPESISRFHAQIHYAEALVGYLQRLGPVTVKGFVGVTEIEHRLASKDPASVIDGAETGIKGIVEIWWNVTDDIYASLDASYTTAHDTRSARVRVGYRLNQSLSLGLEARLDQDGQTDERARQIGTTAWNQSLEQGYLGAFARYEWATGEISASAGINGSDIERTLEEGGVDDEDFGGYATLNVLTRF